MARRFLPYFNTGYQVSNDGVVLSLKGKPLKPSILNTGYEQVILSINGKRVGRTVHSLVAKVWLGKRPKGHYVNHKDGNKRNNRRKNLEYVTPSGNMHHASETGLLPRGSRHYIATIVESDAAQICKLLVKGLGNKAISETLDIPASIIRDIRSGRAWRSVSRNYFDTLRVVPRVQMPMRKRLSLLKDVCSGKLSRKAISEKFGLSPQMISDIKYKRTWLDAWGVFEAR